VSTADAEIHRGKTGSVVSHNLVPRAVTQPLALSKNQGMLKRIPSDRNEDIGE